MIIRSVHGTKNDPRVHGLVDCAQMCLEDTADSAHHLHKACRFAVVGCVAFEPFKTERICVLINKLKTEKPF